MKKFLKLIITINLIILGISLTGCSNNIEIQEGYVPSAEYSGLYPQHEVLGEGKGIYPGRVVWTYDSEAVHWNGEGYWWNPSNFDETVIKLMLQESLETLTGENNINKSWNEIFAYHNNSTHGYQKGEKLAIKVNINGSGVDDDDTSGETNLAYTNPVLLKIFLQSLVNDAGIAPADITVYDVSRIFPDYLIQLCTEGELSGIQFVGRNNAVPDLNEPIEWSYDFNSVISYLPTVVTEADYIINLADLKGHSYGITLTGKNMFGSFINDSSMRPPEYANLHQFLTNEKMDSYSPITDLMAHHQIYSKTVLYLLNALIVAPSEGKDITLENSTWVSEPFDNGFTSSILVSIDPVAIDSVGADILTNQETIINNNPVTGTNSASENYLHEAAQLANTPSGIIYQNNLSSLGVHEHWNNSVDRLYSRNLGEDEGIELIFLNLDSDE